MSRFLSISFLLVLIFFASISLALSDPKESAQLEGPYLKIEEYCSRLKPDAEAICDVDSSWIETTQIVLQRPFIEVKFFSTGDKVTQQCSLALRMESGWFVLADIIECHISAGTVQINARLQKASFKKGILNMELLSQSFHDSNGLHRWVLDATKRVNLSCQVDSRDVPTCRYGLSR